MKAENNLNTFIKDYYAGLDLPYWEKRLNYLVNKISRVKNNQTKATYLLDGYSLYLQLLEIFFIHILAQTQGENTFMHYLFLDNTTLRKDMGKFYKSKNGIEWFIDNFAFGIKEKNNIKDYQQKRQEYLQITKECFEDYLKDYQFLNAYKHGYRVHAQYDPSMSIRINGFNVLNPDTELIYFVKKVDKILKNKILFKHKRFLGKAFFVLGMLLNTQKILASTGKKINLVHYVITNQEEWDNGFGMFRLQEVLFKNV